MQLQAARNLRGVLEGVVGKRHETLGEQPTVWRKEEAEKVGSIYVGGVSARATLAAGGSSASDQAAVAP
jgi:hypothetical protein